MVVIGRRTGRLLCNSFVLGGKNLEEGEGRGVEQVHEDVDDLVIIVRKEEEGLR